jgi:EF hand
MKKVALAVGLAVAASPLLSTAAFADDNKRVRVSVHAPGFHAHYGSPRVHHRPYQPIYHAPRYVYNAPRYAHHHSHRGHWHNGRWIAPVVVGATIGALAVAASTPIYAAPVHTYYEPAPVSYYSAPVDRFSVADVNNDGYLSFYEARRYGNLHRSFAQIDWNGDGYLSRDEVNGWRYSW